MGIKNILFKFKPKVNKPKTILYEAHKINKKLIDMDAIKVVRRLNRFGYEAYIVGGAVRDCLFGKEPKDFDVATNATPRKIKKIFTNSRIIGRRFKLVHIFFRDNIIETATFRAESESDECDESSENDKESLMIKRDNRYGTIEEDVIRRDFSVNALYYDPINEIIVDFVDGFKDVHNRQLKTLKKPRISFLEDPVRMLRAAKYSALLDCNIDRKSVKEIKRCGEELIKCSPSRLYEEINKIFRSVDSEKILSKMNELGLLAYLIPFLNEEYKGADSEELVKRIRATDLYAKDNKEFNHELYWFVLLNSRMSREMAVGSKDVSIADYNNFFYNYLVELKIPKKVCENLSKIVYSFYRMQNIKNPMRVRSIERIKLVLQLFEIYEMDKEVIEFWKECLAKNSGSKKNSRRRRGGRYSRRGSNRKGGSNGSGSNGNNVNGTNSTTSATGTTNTTNFKENTGGGKSSNNNGQKRNIKAKKIVETKKLFI